MTFKFQLYSSSSNLAKRPFCRLNSNFPEICSPFPWLVLPRLLASPQEMSAAALTAAEHGGGATA